MEETQPNKVEAAATRRRRSSILKSQRAPRTPFSELEFNVATPTDTTKSRRVSFSRRTGVAEFVTNEATTTWKNFYEEHNKSLESSGNDSGGVASQQTAGHLGRRSYFDKQFQDDEGLVVDTLNPRDSNVSFNNINFAEQIAALECADDGKSITAPQNQFNLSSFTEHQTKLFDDNMCNPGFGEVTDKIDFNFSAVKPLNATSEKDDLEEIQRDIQQQQQAGSNVICHGPSRDRKSLSEYIEIDELNMTRVPSVHIEESDMSITDTIHSPKVQNVSVKNNSVSIAKIFPDSDWVADKENIVVNPYIAPRESVNFAVNEESEQVLVFDGKRLTVQPQNESLKPTNDSRIANNTIERKDPYRKSIKLNLHDDLPNFVDDMSMSRQLANKFETSDSRNDMSNISFTQALPAKVLLPENKGKRQTIVFDDNDADISVTQAVASNFIMEKQFDKSIADHKNTVIYDDVNISMTQAIPNVIHESNKRKTIIYDNDDGNISFTQVVKANLIPQSKPLDKEEIYHDNDISMTQAVDNIILTQTSNKRNTIVFDNESNDISMTQVLPSNVIMSCLEPQKESDDQKAVDFPKRKTVFYEDDTNSISMTETVPVNILAESLRAKASNSNITNFENVADISMTQALPVNILENKENKRTTIVFDDYDMGDISVTQVVPTNIMDNITNVDSRIKNAELENVKVEATLIDDDKGVNKRKTIIFEDKTDDISMTQAVPTNIIYDVKNESLKQEINEHIELSKTQDVLDEINSIIDYKMDSRPTQNNEDTKEIKNFERNSETELENQAISENYIPVNKSQKNSNVFHQEVLVCQAELKFRWRSKKKRALIEESSEASDSESTNQQSSEVEDLSPVVSNTKVLNDLLNMSAASVNIENESAIPVKREQSKKSVSYEDDVCVHAIDALEKKSKKIDENDDSEFQMDVALDKERPSAIDIVQSLPDVGVNTDVEVKSDLDVEVIPVLEEKSKEVQVLVEKQSILDTETYDDVETDTGVDTQTTTTFESKTRSETNSSVEKLKETDPKKSSSDDITNSDVINSVEVKSVVDLATEKTDYDSDDATIPSRRLSKVPSRQSIAPTRDEILHDITMAQQMLQNTNFDLENTSSLEDTTIQCSLDDDDEKQETREKDTPEVVKKLHFEDETLSDTSVKSEQNVSALKKDLYNAPPEEKDDFKVKVIPPFQEVTDELKDLMNDLTKPLPDVMPFENTTDMRQRTSTCSMQIQANLITSSQIEIASSESVVITDEPAPSRSKFVSFAKPNEQKREMTVVPENKSFAPLVFDPHNPLNNVFIMPTDQTEVHGYNPIKCKENFAPAVKQDEIIGDNTGNDQKVGVIDNLLLVQSGSPLSHKEVKHSEVNTNISVKEDIELLRIHSCLTVIDETDNHNTASSDTEGHETSDTSVLNNQDLKAASSPTLVDPDARPIDPSDSDSYTSDVASDSSLKNAKAKKRSYSPSKSIAYPHEVELTPKPSSKILKESNSPSLTLVDDTLSSIQMDMEFEGVWEDDDLQKCESNRIVKKRSHNSQKQPCNPNIETTPVPKSKIQKKTTDDKENKTVVHEKIVKKSNKKLQEFSDPAEKPGTNVIVQSALVALNRPSVRKEGNTKETSQEVQEKFLRVGNSKIVAKIDKLPFMGKECTWEACNRDSFVFLLLKDRIRLTVKFARTKYHIVREDTPVESISVVQTNGDIKNELAQMCVKFTVETINNFVEAQKIGTADGVPLFLNRCASVCRVASQWCRAMVDASYRLGFTVEDDTLVFHVATPLPLVWRLRVRVALARDPARLSYPCARDVTLGALLGGDVTRRARQVHAELAAVPAGWGHVPTAVWTIFRYLKNLKKDNEMLAIV